MAVPLFFNSGHCAGLRKGVVAFYDKIQPFNLTRFGHLMITAMGLLKFRNGLSVEQVRGVASGVGRPGTPFAVGYDHIQNVVIDRTQKAIDHARGSLDVDCVSQFAFPDLSASIAAAKVAALDFQYGLENADIIDVVAVTALQNTVIAPPTRWGALKRMSLLRRRADVSSAEFQDQWFNMHSVLVKRLPGVLGYRQNLVFDGARGDGASRIDGVVELWFESAEAIESAFRSDRGTTLMAHAKEFIDEITTFLVTPLTITLRRDDKS